jgi:hypothetical protein
MMMTLGTESTTDYYRVDNSDSLSSRLGRLGRLGTPWFVKNAGGTTGFAAFFGRGGGD